MLPSEQIQFLVSGLNSGYMKEWLDIYTAVADFVYEMYKERYSMYKQSTETAN